MAKSLSPSEYRRLKKDAKAFARRAQAGQTYYVVTVHGGVKSGLRVSEVVFKKKALVGLMAGGISPEQLYLRHGRVYEDRYHPDIAQIPTGREYDEMEAKHEAAFLGSPGHYEAVRDLSNGTGFRSTW